MHKLSQAAALFFTAMITITAHAGDHGKGSGSERGGDRLARMQQHLGLSDEQVGQIQDIRANGGGRDEISAVLTDDQRAQLEEHRAQRKERQQHGHQQRSQDS